MEEPVEEPEEEVAEPDVAGEEKEGEEAVEVKEVPQAWGNVTEPAVCPGSDCGGDLGVGVLAEFLDPMMIHDIHDILDIVLKVFNLKLAI